MRKIFKITVALFFLLPFSVGLAEKLEIRVRQNDLHGEIWSNENQKIKIKIEDSQKNGVGIGENFVIDGLQKNLGGIKFSHFFPCYFSWEKTPGQPETKIEKEILLPIFEQLPAGNYLFPPEKIPDFFAISGTEDQICKNNGNQEDFENFEKWRMDFSKNNPFLKNNFQSFLQINLPAGNYFAEVETGEKVEKKTPIKIWDKNDNSEKILSGFHCSKENNGEEIFGICQKNFSIFENKEEKIDFLILKTTDYLENSSNLPEIEIGKNAENSQLVTIAGNFFLRSSVLLNWALDIEETGIRHQKITEIYKIFLQLANGFFIIAILAIAFLFNFVAFLPKDSSKKILFLLIFSAIFINFSLPISRVLIDGSNIIQETFLSAPKNSQNNERISANDFFEIKNLDPNNFVGQKKSFYLPKNYPENIDENSSDNFDKSNKFVDRFSEQTLFQLFLVFSAGFLQFLLALILLFRDVILIFLVLFSPFLFILFLFPATRTIFVAWIKIYFRWIFIGPILAMCLFIAAQLWSLGIPIESNFSAPSANFLQNTTNIFISLPGNFSADFQTPREIMKFLSGLMMLFLAVFLPFALTKFSSHSSSLENIENIFKKIQKNEIGDIFNQKKRELSEKGKKIFGILGKSEKFSEISDHQSQIISELKMKKKMSIDEKNDNKNKK